MSLFFSLHVLTGYICRYFITFFIFPGYMTWWGVRLDGVALINLIMCIGFSVDFSAHICYHYLTG